MEAAGCYHILYVLRFTHIPEANTSRPIPILPQCNRIWYGNETCIMMQNEVRSRARGAAPNTDSSYAEGGQQLWACHDIFSLLSNQKQDLFNSAEFSASVLMDVCHLLCNPKSHDCRVIHALSDTHRLFGAARTQLKSAEKG